MTQILYRPASYRCGVVKNGSLLDPRTPGGLWLQKDGAWGEADTALRFRSDAEADAAIGDHPHGIFQLPLRGAAPAVRSVSFILGGSAYVSREAWDRGDVTLRAYTKAGKPRYQRARYRGETRQPLFVSRCLTIDSIGEAR